MKNNKVFHFVFCEDRSNPNDKLEPFIFEMLQSNIPCLYVIDIPSFNIFLEMFDTDQVITVWIHHQANSSQTDEYGRNLGENMGAKLINTYPQIKFKYITRAPNHPARSNDRKSTPIISLIDLYEEIEKEENFQRISDFKTETKTNKTMDKNEKPVNQYNISFGGDNKGNFSIGDYNQLTIKGNKEVLSKELSKQNISDHDIQELLKILDTDEHNFETKEFGVNTKNWIQKMIDKAQNGVWQVATGAAGGILTELLKGFLGM